jgi:hypothetical protein
MQTDMGGYQPWQAGTSGSLKAYEPTWRDRLARVLMGEQRASPERARLVEGLTGSTGLGNSSIGVADFVPGVGQAFQAQEAVRSGQGPETVMAIFGGPAAKTANLQAMSKAQALAKQGAPREQIWNETGWFQGKDGKWRFEIDDSGASLTPRLSETIAGKNSVFRGNASEGIQHPAMFDAYPDMATERMVSNYEPNAGGAYWRNADGGPGGGFSAVGPDAAIVKSTAMHELGGHGVQAREGFAGGGTSADLGMDAYNRLAGEVEARTVQKRMDYTPEQRASRPPWLDYDVPEDQQIVRMGGSGPQMSASNDALANALMTGAVDDTAKAGIRAYHGSPHDFDRFDMSKIGTGEGAQAYGHGLYFAESEGVAKSYKESLKANDAPAATARWAMQEASGDTASAIEKVRGSMAWKEANGGLSDADRAKHLDAIKRLESGAVDGRMYEVRINASPDDFLDWDKPLSAQSEKVREAIKTNPVAKDAEWFANNTTGNFAGEKGTVSQFVEGLRRGLFDGRPQSELIKELGDAGIPGIRYLDQGSRSAGDGSRNYVVFRDDIIDIVKKYGIAAAASMYGMDQVQRVMLADQLQPAQQ